MKIEMDDNSSVVAGILIIVIAAIVMSLGGCQITEQTKREAFKAGMSQEISASSQAVLWVNKQATNQKGNRSYATV